MKLLKYLGNLGYGTRRDMERLLRGGHVTRADGSVLRDGDDVEHEDVRVDGKPLDAPPGSVVMLHKPLGYVCSTRDASRLIYELLPPRFTERKPVMAPVGRLDRDTTGLLLITDDGQLNHRITSPKRHLSKTYEAQLASDLRGDETALFASGALVLDGEPAPLRPAALEMLGPRQVRITITEGRYHQVRRMFAAAGNHVTALHRTAIGGLALGTLESGRWRLLAPPDMAALFD